MGLKGTSLASVPSGASTQPSAPKADCYALLLGRSLIPIACQAERWKGQGDEPACFRVRLHRRGPGWTCLLPDRHSMRSPTLRYTRGTLRGSFEVWSSHRSSLPAKRERSSVTLVSYIVAHLLSCSTRALLVVASQRLAIGDRRDSLMAQVVVVTGTLDSCRNLCHLMMGDAWLFSSVLLPVFTRTLADYRQSAFS